MATEHSERSIVDRTLAEIGAASSSEIRLLFGARQNEFDADVEASCTDLLGLDSLERKWKSRKGLLARIGENWLRPAPSEIKPTVGQELNKLKQHIEVVLQERRKFLEADFVARADS